MFKVGQNVYSQTSGICVISLIEAKNFGIGEKEYFVLESIFKKQASKTAFLQIIICFLQYYNKGVNSKLSLRIMSF